MGLQPRFSLVVGMVMVMVMVVSALWGGSPAIPAGAISGAATLNTPADGATLTSLGASFAWTNPAGVTQYQLQVIPPNNDGPGVNIIRNVESSYTIPPPPTWYVMLPDMTYTWRVRVTDKATFAAENDPSWGPWAERRFRTPAVTSAGITSLMPAAGEVVTTLTPTLQWGNNRPDVFYYEVQVSKDATFNTNPDTATAAVYSELRHGGATAPMNGYAVPTSFPLENNAKYYWRVRPRVQGDGTPLAWSSTFHFQTNTAAARAFTANPITFGLTAADATTCQMSGAVTTLASTPTLTGVFFSYAYTGSGALSRNYYFNGAPALSVSSTATGPSGCYRSNIGVPGGAPDAGSPLSAGTWKLELWQGGQLAQSSTLTVTPATALAFGPISAGTGLDTTSSGCRLSGTATTFASGSKSLYFRYNAVGSGTYTVTLWNGTTMVRMSTSTNSTATCRTGTETPTGGFTAGTWRREVSVDGKVLQSVSFTIN